MLRGFKNFLMRGDVIVVAVGLVVALAFSGLIAAFTTNIINPIVARLPGRQRPIGLGVQLGSDHNPKTFVDFGVLHLRRSFTSSSSSPLCTSSSWCPTSTSRPAAVRWCSAIPRRSRPARPACPATCPPAA